MAPSKKRKVRTRNPKKDTIQEVEQKINARDFLCEREFAKTSSYKFYNQAKAYGLSKLLGKRKEGNAFFVRHYYVHAAFYHGCIRLRDKQLVIGLDDIREFYGLPVVAAEDCMYSKLKDAKADFPYTQIAAELVLGGEDTWFAPNHNERYLARADLTPEAKCWMHLVANNISPTSHATRLTRNMCLLIFLLKTNQPVQLEEIIYQAIETCSRSHSHKLIFPHLISDLFLKAKVPQLDSDERFKPHPPFNYTHVLSHKSPAIRVQMRARKVKPPSPTMQQFNELQKKVDKIYDLLSRLAIFHGFPMDTPESSQTNTAAANLLEIGVGGDAEEVNSESEEETDHTAAESQDSETEESHSEGEAAGQGRGKVSVEATSGSEYNPDEDDD